MYAEKRTADENFTRWPGEVSFDDPHVKESPVTVAFFACTTKHLKAQICHEF